MKKIIEILVLPVALMNIISGVVGGIWLLVLGEWRLLIIGLILTFTAHWYLGLIMMITTPFEMIGIRLYEKGSKWHHLFIYLSLLFTNILLAASCVVAYLICTSYFGGEIGAGLIPYVLWSWGMALGPWRFLASRGGEPNIGIINMIFSASILYLFFIISVFVGPVTNLLATALFLLVQIIIMPFYLTFQKKDIY
ncbi:MAG: hypothetical protein K9N07_10785 [Candidatus Cloacimonetes bacterium]|nr:hypothetical protein [Candidatus Cloacimonadota bacterium]